MSDQQVSVLDQDVHVRDALFSLLSSAGFTVRTYNSTRHFLADYVPLGGCLISNIVLPEMGGLALYREMAMRGVDVPVIFIADAASVPLAVTAMKAGAVDFIEKPIDGQAIISCVRRALKISERILNRASELQIGRDASSILTPREKLVLSKLASGSSNKSMAFELGISTRTVEFHRARIMAKLKVQTISDLLRIALAVEQAGDELPPLAKLWA